jgi:hypothetical protein
MNLAGAFWPPLIRRARSARDAACNLECGDFENCLKKSRQKKCTWAQSDETFGTSATRWQP